MQKTAYEMRISDWSSDVCSSDLFFTEFGCQALFQFSDGRGVDVLEALAAGVVERRGAHFFQELFDHRADSHDLRRLLDHLGDGLGSIGRASCRERVC